MDRCGVCGGDGSSCSEEIKISGYMISNGTTQNSGQVPSQSRNVKIIIVGAEIGVIYKK